MTHMKTISSFAEPHDYIYNKIRLRVAAWKEVQRRHHYWVNLAEVISWCGREIGGIAQDSKRRQETYDELQRSLVAGEFDHQGRPQVLVDYDLPHSCEYYYRFRLRPDQPKRVNLDYTWIRRTHARAWFTSRSIALPPWLTDVDMDLTSAEHPTSASKEANMQNVPEIAAHKSGAFVHKFVRSFIMAETAAGRMLSQRKLEASWIDAGFTGHRDNLRREFRKQSPFKPSVGRPSKMRQMKMRSS